MHRRVRKRGARVCSDRVPRRTHVGLSPTLHSMMTHPVPSSAEYRTGHAKRQSEHQLSFVPGALAALNTISTCRTPAYRESNPPNLFQSVLMARFLSGSHGASRRSVDGRQPMIPFASCGGVVGSRDRQPNRVGCRTWWPDLAIASSVSRGRKARPRCSMRRCRAKPSSLQRATTVRRESGARTNAARPPSLLPPFLPPLSPPSICTKHRYQAILDKRKARRRPPRCAPARKRLPVTRSIGVTHAAHGGLHGGVSNDRTIWRIAGSYRRRMRCRARGSRRRPRCVRSSRGAGFTGPARLLRSSRVAPRRPQRSLPMLRCSLLRRRSRSVIS